MGMFRPDGTSKPRTRAGNLKQYHLALFNDSLRLADKNDVEAISSTTGFVTPYATAASRVRTPMTTGITPAR